MNRRFLKQLIIDSGLINHSIFSMRDKIILKRYFEEEKTLKEIALIMGENHNTINGYIESALKKCVNVIFDLNQKKRRLKSIVKENEVLKNKLQISSSNNIIDSEPISIYQLNFSPRAEKALLELGVQDLLDLEGITADQICKNSSAGKKTMMEIADKCLEYGITIKL